MNTRTTTITPVAMADDVANGATPVKKNRAINKNAGGWTKNPGFARDAA